VHVYHGTVVDHALAIRGLTPRREWLVRGVVAGWLAEVVAGSRAQRIAVSDATAAEVKRRYRTRVHRVIPNGVDTTMFRPGDKLQARRRWGLDQDRPYALYVGRMEARKAPHVAAQACGIAGWPLVVAGRGSPPAGALHVGSLAPADLAELYRAVDAVVMPTLYEGCSLVILEALASGVPVVTTPVGWVPTLLAAAPRYAGLIGPAEPGDLARRLRSLETSGLEDAVARARAFVTRECSLDVFTERWRQALGLGADVVTSRTP
jgi:glycosyltransferase involved in cell wall biosynthesis